MTNDLDCLKNNVSSRTAELVREGWDLPFPAPHFLLEQDQITQNQFLSFELGELLNRTQLKQMLFAPAVVRSLFITEVLFGFRC